MTLTLIYKPLVNHNDNFHHQPPHTPAASPRQSTNFLNRKVTVVVRHRIVEDKLMRQKARLLLDEAASWSLLWK